MYNLSHVKSSIISQNNMMRWAQREGDSQTWRLRTPPGLKGTTSGRAHLKSRPLPQPQVRAGTIRFQRIARGCVSCAWRWNYNP